MSDTRRNQGKRLQEIETRIVHSTECYKLKYIEIIFKFLVILLDNSLQNETFQQRINSIQLNS